MPAFGMMTIDEHQTRLVAAVDVTVESERKRHARRLREAADLAAESLQHGIRFAALLIETEDDE